MEATGGIAAGRASQQQTLEGVELATSVQSQDRQLIRRGRMVVHVDRVADAQHHVERTVAALGGQVVRTENRSTNAAHYALRVPASRLDAAMDSVARVGSVRERTVSTYDATESIVDTDARVASLRATRDRLRTLLERANSVQDVVTVERELARVQGELDSLEGRLRLLRSQVAMSDLDVEIRRRVVLGPVGLIAKGIGIIIGKLFVWR